MSSHNLFHTMVFSSSISRRLLSCFVLYDHRHNVADFFTSLYPLHSLRFGRIIALHLVCWLVFIPIAARGIARRESLHTRTSFLRRDTTFRSMSEKPSIGSNPERNSLGVGVSIEPENILTERRISADASLDLPFTTKTMDALITESTGSTTVGCSHRSATSILEENKPCGPMNDPIEIQKLMWEQAKYVMDGSKMTSKRTDYISWDDYFMAVASLSARRSKDPIHPTGACIVDHRQRILGIGFNGFPRGCHDDCMPWTINSINWLQTQSPYVVHAEVNAILNKCIPDCDGARLYTRYFPCNECAKVIVQSGISEVVYVEGPSPPSSIEHESSTVDPNQKSSLETALPASLIILKLSGVTIRPYRPTQTSIDLDFWTQLNETERQVAIVQSQTVSLTQQSPPSSSADEVTIQQHREWLVQEAQYDPVLVGSTKRLDVLSWDDYFMALALLTARRSKDPSTQVGACIVDSDRRIRGVGYNGFPNGCSDDVLPWARDAHNELHTKYPYVCHAEMNAILNKGSSDVRGGTIYVALFPCNECAQIIIQSDIREVVYMSDKYHDQPKFKASRFLFERAGIKLRKHVPLQPMIRLQLCDSHIIE